MMMNDLIIQNVCSFSNVSVHPLRTKKEGATLQERLNPEEPRKTVQYFVLEYLVTAITVFDSLSHWLLRLITLISSGSI